MLPLADYLRYCSILDNAIANPDCVTEKEADFTNSLRDKMQKFKRRTFVSEAQASWLHSIETVLQDHLGSDYEDNVTGY